MPKPLFKQDIHLADLSDTAAVARQLTQALHEAHGVRAQGPAFSETVFKQWEAVVRAMGEPCTEGEDGATGVKNQTMWIDVRYDAERQHTFRHSCTPQPLHTDSAYDPKPQDITFFLCQEPSVSDGETTFVSAETVDDTARAFDKKLHEDLWNLRIPYGKAGQRGREVPVLRRDEGGIIVNWNYYRVLSEDNPRIEAFRQKFHAFLQEQIVDKKRVTPMRLNSGGVLLFQDERVMHGRFGFPPSPRCIWKCAFNRV